MNETSQVVIIGAGIQGLSIAYHLAKSGITDVIVVEKEFIGAGSSGRSASMLMMQRENEAKIRLSQYSYQRYMGFKDELGIDIGFKKIGFLSIVPERKKDIALEMALLRQKLGVKTDILTPEEIKKVVPFVNLDGILFGVFGPDDGVIDPHSIMQGFANRAKDLGVTIKQGVNATGIKIQNNKVVAVETTEGLIFTSFVVNAAGAKAKEVAQWVGVNLPIANRVRSIFITDQFPDIPSDGPMVEDADVEWYYRKEGPGVLMGMGKEETRNVSMSINWDFLPKVIEFATYRVPILASASILRGWSGVRPLTPDITPIIGPVPELEGFINCCGWGGEGVMHAPAGGQIVSEYITGVKDKTFSLEPFLVSRFRI